MRLYDITRCEGAKCGAAEASLCTRCAHAQSYADGPFIQVEVRIEQTQLGERVHCPQFLKAERAD